MVGISSTVAYCRSLNGLAFVLPGDVIMPWISPVSYCMPSRSKKKKFPADSFKNIVAYIQTLFGMLYLPVINNNYYFGLILCSATNLMIALQYLREREQVQLDTIGVGEAEAAHCS